MITYPRSDGGYPFGLSVWGKMNTNDKKYDIIARQRG